MSVSELVISCAEAKVKVEKDAADKLAADKAAKEAQEVAEAEAVEPEVAPVTEEVTA